MKNLSLSIALIMGAALFATLACADDTEICHHVRANDKGIYCKDADFTDEKYPKNIRICQIKTNSNGVKYCQMVDKYHPLEFVDAKTGKPVKTYPNAEAAWKAYQNGEDGE
jgi:hypothetical protein